MRQDVKKIEYTAISNKKTIIGFLKQFTPSIPVHISLWSIKGIFQKQNVPEKIHNAWVFPMNRQNTKNTVKSTEKVINCSHRHPTSLSPPYQKGVPGQRQTPSLHLPTSNWSQKDRESHPAGMDF